MSELTKKALAVSLKKLLMPSRIVVPIFATVFLIVESAETIGLVITIPEFSFEGGGIVAKSDKQKVINVRDKYEPYRAYVRNLLFFIVIACAFVLIIKNILNYHGVFDDSNSDKGGSKN